MELVVRDLEIESLKQHLEMCREYCGSLAREFEGARSSVDQANLAFTWDAALKHSYMVQLLLELMERREREGRSEAGVQHIRLKAYRHRASAGKRRVPTTGFAPRISSTPTGS